MKMLLILLALTIVFTPHGSDMATLRDIEYTNEAQLFGEKEIKKEHSSVSKCPYSFWPQPEHLEFTSEQEGGALIKLASPLDIITSVADPSTKDLLKTGIRRYLPFLNIPNLFNAEAERAAAKLFTDKEDAHFETVDKLFIYVKTSNTKLDLHMDESYTITIDKSRVVKEEEEDHSQKHEKVWFINMSANSIFGMMRALETFSQLVSVVQVSGEGDEDEVVRFIRHVPVHISDRPRFPHRGIMLDTSRHFFPVEDIISLLDAMSYNKLNVFHWHMTDAQSFPFILKSCPELAMMGAYSREETYTRKDVKRIIREARERGIIVIPEIDIPAHTCSWGFSHPEVMACCNKQSDWFDFAAAPPAGQLNPTTEATYILLDKILHEFSELFPYGKIHIGLDEVNMNCWLSEPSIVSFMRDKNFSPSQLLQYFADKVAAILKKYNRQAIAWEDSFQAHHLDLDKETILQVWYNKDSAKDIIAKGHYIICSYYTDVYLDRGLGIPFASYNESLHPDFKNAPMYSWQHMYLYEPTKDLSENETSFVLGGEALMWTELVDTNNVHAIIWPRASAVAAGLWERHRQPLNKLTESRFIIHNERLVSRGIRSAPCIPKWNLLHSGY